MGQRTRGSGPLGTRPVPPASLGQTHQFEPAPEVLAWVQKHILDPDGVLHNADHAHLADVSLTFLWAAESFDRQGRRVVGQAEELMFRCGPWQRARQEQQMADWFGTVPDFVITLAADFCREADDVTWCALVEHELYHVAPKLNEFGSPRFDRFGAPMVGIRGHDVEEFVGVVQRYGVGPADGALAKMVAAAGRKPEIPAFRAATACGTCVLRAA
jgi:hypothetical protein